MKLLRRIFVGRALSLSDSHLFRKVSLIALLAWVGLGADGLSSSCYGPEAVFRALGAHSALAPLVGTATVITIAVICASYSQIIEVFPSGGGGYLVASRLLSPGFGVVSGCALLVDYILTIALSIASGADALFSLAPLALHEWKLAAGMIVTACLTLINLRGVKESVLFWTPVFFLFLVTHAFAIMLGIGTHFGDLPKAVGSTLGDVTVAYHELGGAGLLLLLAYAYSVGAGTYTGIEAVSNGLPVLREPKVETGKRTMLYMAVSLSLTVGGLLFAYMLYGVTAQEGKTLNAVLFERLTGAWPHGNARIFIAVSMVSAALLLFIAAQAGFLDGPRVLANMALDRWLPSRFAALSDRFVTQNGILVLGIAAMIVLYAARGSVALLVVLYSINVFITFTLSQIGMVKHWWIQRSKCVGWRRKLSVNAVGFCLTGSILLMLVCIKFTEGGWVTLLVTGSFVALAFLVRRHYKDTIRKLAKLEELVRLFETGALFLPLPGDDRRGRPARNGKTAVVFVNGFNGLGVHTIVHILKMFPGIFTNFIFLQIGVIDAGNFKGSDEIEKLRTHISLEANRYVAHMKQIGFQSSAFTEIGAEVVEPAGNLAAQVVALFPDAVFFGGQLVFAKESWLTGLFHNYVVFALQKQAFNRGMPFLILPIRV